MSEEVTEAVKNWSEDYLNFLAKKGEKPKQLQLWHGTRRRETPEEVKAKGICTFKSEVEGRLQIIQALRHFGKEKLLTTTGTTGQHLQSLMAEISSRRRRVIWATTLEDRVCGWSARNPEIVLLALSAAQVPSSDIAKYLRGKYGRCYKIKLRHTVPINYPNIPLNSMCLKPEDIESVEECGEFEEGVHCDEDGSCK